MEIRKILAVLLIAVLFTSTRFSSTLARYTDVSSGKDTALIAKWNMGARGEDDVAGEFYNKGFSFNLFDSQRIEPMSYGEKSFTFRGGGSDVAIAYDVKMNASDLMRLTAADTKATIAKESGKDVYAPFIFKITAAINTGATDTVPTVFSPYTATSPYYGTGWFRPKDADLDEEGCFSIFAGTPDFSAGSDDEVTITVSWQWNTSYYINDTGIAAVTPNTVTADPSTAIADRYLPYYQEAYDEYYDSGGLLDRYAAAVNAMDQYLEVNGSPDSDGNWPSDETEDLFAQYNALARAADNALEACQTSLLAAYDDYDTFAVNALDAKESAGVLFRLSGEQIAPN